MFINQMMADATPRDFWKKLFNRLFNNLEPDERLANMWTRFKANNLHKSDLREAIQSFSDHLHEDVKYIFFENIRDESEIEDGLSASCKEASPQCYQIPPDVMGKLCDLSISETVNCASIVDSLKKCSDLDDDFWRLLFTYIRDQEVRGISDENMITILEGGQTKQMSMKDIESKFLSENPLILKTQQCIPDQMIHEDLIDAHLNTETVRESLRRSYERELQEAKTRLIKDNPKMTEQEAEKQAPGQAKQETKESREAKQLQHRVAMKAEELVQSSILRAMKEFGIPVYVFRGVNTYADIGKFLEKFGIKMSKLKAFETGNSKATLECEHDIAVVALLPVKPLVSFLQVDKSYPRQSHVSV